MSDHKPIAIAITVGTLAIAANGAAAIVAISATARPEALGFGVAGLAAAFVGLTLTLLWASSGDPREQPESRKFFTPWKSGTLAIAAEPEPEEIPLLPQLDEQASIAAIRLAMAAQPAARPCAQTRPQPRAMPSPGNDQVVVYLRDWLQERRGNLSA